MFLANCDILDRDRQPDRGTHRQTATDVASMFTACKQGGNCDIPDADRQTKRYIDRDQKSGVVTVGASMFTACKQYGGKELGTHFLNISSSSSSVSKQYS